MTTLQQLYEEYEGKTVSYRIIVGGADITNLVDDFGWGFATGEVPTADISIAPQNMVEAIAEEAEVEIWFGYKIGFIDIRVLVFGGAVVDSVSYDGSSFKIECIQDGARRLNYPYYKQITYDFDNVTAQDAVTALLTLAGVPNFHVDLDPWDIGTAVPQKIDFSNYGDGINKVSTVDGSVWFALPSGQIRVEKRDPLPYDNPARTYYRAHLEGIVESQPAGVPNPNARPRILQLTKRYDRPGVNNFINVDGATLVTLGPNGEQNSDQIHEEVDAAPGSFDNGAPWITTPPLFQPFTYNNELIDTDAKANAVANRYLLLQNRLIQELSVTIPCDPLLFLCMTVQIIDEEAEVDDLYFLKAYRCSVSASQVTSELTLLGGPYAGTQGFASPFAEFRWTYQDFWNRIGGNNEVGSTGSDCNSAKANAGFQTNLAQKLCQDIPADVGSEDQGGNKGTAIGTVMIGFDGSMSQDFDGTIVSYVWEDSQGHTGSGPRVTFIYDPEEDSSIEMTLTVTDDTARTDSITKTVYVGATAPVDPLPDNPTLNDTDQGGGVASGDCTDGGDPTRGGSGLPGNNGMALVYAVPAMCKAMMTKDNRTWNMLDKDDLGVGNFISVDLASDYDTGVVTALFGTDRGEIVKTTDGAQTGSIVHQSGGGEAFNGLVFDTKECGTAYAYTDKGQMLKSSDNGSTWSSVRPRDNVKINKILMIGNDMFFFGGDGVSGEKLIRKSSDRGKTLYPVHLPNQMITAALLGGGVITTASLNHEKLLVGFAGGGVWTTSDIETSGSWTEVSGITGPVRSSAPGNGGEFKVSTDDGDFSSSDGETFTPGCSTPHNDMNWEGLPGVYIGVSDSSIDKIVDDTCGPMMPNPDLTQTPMPVCAIPQKIRVAPIPRPPAGSGIWPDISTPVWTTIPELLASLPFGGSLADNTVFFAILDESVTPTGTNIAVDELFTAVGGLQTFHGVLIRPVAQPAHVNAIATPLVKIFEVDTSAGGAGTFAVADNFNSANQASIAPGGVNRMVVAYGQWNGSAGIGTSQTVTDMSVMTNGSGVMNWDAVYKVGGGGYAIGFTLATGQNNTIVAGAVSVTHM
jgi:hypothetical protein